MKDRTIACLALAVSFASLAYAAWVHSQADALAEAALHRREKQLVEKLAPNIQALYKGLEITNRIDHPTTLEQLFMPYLDVMNRVVNAPSDTGTNR